MEVQCQVKKGIEPTAEASSAAMKVNNEKDSGEGSAQSEQRSGFGPWMVAHRNRRSSNKVRKNKMGSSLESANTTVAGEPKRPPNPSKKTQSEKIGTATNARSSESTKSGSRFAVLETEDTMDLETPECAGGELTDKITEHSRGSWGSGFGGPGRYGCRGGFR